MSGENKTGQACPFPSIIRPPYGIGKRAADLQCLIGLEGELDPSIIPPVPGEVVEALGSEREVARYEQESAFALDAISFALWLREPAQDERLKGVDYTSSLSDRLTFLPGLPREGFAERRVHRAISKYSRQLGSLSREFMKVPELGQLRDYRKIKQKEAGNRRSLWRSYHGRVVLEMCLQAMNTDFFEQELPQPEAEVLENSISTLSFIGTLPRIRAVSYPPMPRISGKAAWEYMGPDIGRNLSTRALRGVFGAHEGTFEPVAAQGEQIGLTLDRLKITEALRNQSGPLPHPKDVQRSNNLCPAVVSVPGIADGKSTARLIVEQMLDVFQHRGNVFEPVAAQLQ